MTKAEKSGRLRGFDALRGIAALLVFIFHFYGLNGMEGVEVAGFDLTPFFDAGFVGLNIFFVLSGFLIFMSIYKHGVNKEYFLRRILRIAPIYYFSLLMVVIFMMPEILMTLVGWWDVVSHVLFVQSFSAETYYGINPVLWSLSIEMIFYLFLPLFFLVSGKKGWRILLGCLIMILVTYWYRDYMMQFYNGWDWQQRVIYTENFVGRLDHFAFGMLASYAFLKLKGKDWAWLKVGSLVFMGIGLFGMWWGMNVFHELGSSFRDFYYYQIFLHSIIGLSAAVFMFGLAKTFSWFKWVFGNKPLEWFGAISYSFYIWHFIISEKVALLDIGIYEKFGFSLVLITALSVVTYLLVERPFLRKKRYRRLP